ncbi:JAB domain-containing protein [Acetivibrio ethanolgignens]|uniref:MPN domain-containing protein n=1 Tax=Acetivibrio ethanolgignens TaxID=290052 RepID=A0A0V8QEZ2_9FIRM|nr:JAB domain-containing protein [Acetivibrio ethanolgignens]KSV59160.1 hypothetical protein ASU35_10410 [Acetivibrio ethanolgignens]
MIVFDLIRSEEGIPGIQVVDRVEYSNSVRNSSLTVDMLNEVFGMNKRVEEWLVLVVVHADLSVAGVSIVARGCVDAAMFEPGLLLLRVIAIGCNSFIVAHNHPSGNPTPSDTDKSTTKQLREAAKLLGCNLLDHVIIGYDSFVSVTD